jgi:probable phosphoglycerate mutase
LGSITTIALIRHGCTSWNKEGRAQGNSDISLDQEGIFQAEQLADRLSKEEWNQIYTSPLARAKQTALILANAIGVEVHMDDRLKEQAGGLIEGTTEQERLKKWGKNWRDLDLGIEPIEEVQKRGNQFFEEIEQKHRGEKILVVSHGAFIQINFKHLFPDYPSKHFGNTSLTILEKVHNQWTCHLHNCTRHLEGNHKES